MYLIHKVLTKNNSKIIGLFIVLGINLGYATPSHSQLFNDYEQGIVDIIKCNDRTGFDLGIIEFLAAGLRLRILFMGILVVSAISLSKSVTVLKVALYVVLAFSSVNMIYELGVKKHMEQAKNLSVFSASIEQKNSLSTEVIEGDPLGVDNFPGTDISNPPIGNDGRNILPPPPPLQGFVSKIRDRFIRGESQEVETNNTTLVSHVCQPSLDGSEDSVSVDQDLIFD